MFKKKILVKYSKPIAVGALITLIVVISGIFIGPSLYDWFISDKSDNDHSDYPNYQWIFDYHSNETLLYPISTIKITYQEKNSSYLHNEDPYLVGIWASRDPTIKHDCKRADNIKEFIQNDSIWEVACTFGDTIRNDTKVLYIFGGKTYINGSRGYVGEDYLTYELNQIMNLLYGGINNASEVDLGDYNYTIDYYSYISAEESVPVYEIPANWVFSIRFDFLNYTHVRFLAHQDGWIQLTRSRCISYELDQCMEEEGYGEYYYCNSGSQDGPIQYLSFGENFDPFHTFMREYLNTHMTRLN